ncbi:LysM peptidoglycan-binding domain-containing protein [Oceanispirochaeta sp.]|jgi:nucleoid-associated protein YgaU|uniref:LysM peptidoglycan-binding domain-containing protein n=1 Tax=Oceanispirochaeta sp. TaxID=2035350 RepID=UPI00263820C1|nr:LysM peptidoglycan-binding domain-containing protein [Oceanispirochaeta sp.]MDA3957882.1 LysM peptidoglycan-binding domain-containing protein [Oceanispirochaeta sp.]
MNKKILFTLLFLSLFIVLSCKTAPEPVEEPVEEAVPEEVIEEPVVESGQTQTPVVEVKPEPPKVNPVSREEIALARQALERAEMVDASRFAPELMAEGYSDLKKAMDLAESDPDAARLLLAGVKEKADKAFDMGRNGLKVEALAALDSMKTKLLAINADKYSPEPYGQVLDQFALTRKEIEAENLIEARKAMALSKTKANNLYKILDENIRWIGILERDSKAYLSDAEAEEAYLWADEEFNQAGFLLSQGMIQFRQYDLKGSESTLKEAKFRAKNTLYLTRVRKQQADNDARLMQIQMELEEASTLMIQTETGAIKEASPWSGSDYLDKNPLLDAKTEDYEAEDSELIEYDLTKVIEEEEEEIVSSSDGVSTLLEKAKDLWQQAIAERNAGNYGKSKELLTQAEAYIRAYKANAVGKTYTVVYRKEKTDCLWRIAEFKEIYNDPFLWPKIWQRNQKAIPNPDLIYPGQVLIIPPVE